LTDILIAYGGSTVATVGTVVLMNITGIWLIRKCLNG